MAALGSVRATIISLRLKIGRWSLADHISAMMLLILWMHLTADAVLGNNSLVRVYLSIAEISSPTLRLDHSHNPLLSLTALQDLFELCLLRYPRSQVL